MNLFNGAIPKFTARMTLFGPKYGLTCSSLADNNTMHYANLSGQGKNIALAQRCPPCEPCDPDTNTQECYEWRSGPQECVSFTRRCHGTSQPCCGPPNCRIC